MRDVRGTRLNLVLTPRVLRALVRRTAGNPFWALEVGRALVRKLGIRSRTELTRLLSDQE
jgi:hypothetical protein